MELSFLAGRERVGDVPCHGVCSPSERRWHLTAPGPHRLGDRCGGEAVCLRTRVDEPGRHERGRRLRCAETATTRPPPPDHAAEPPPAPDAAAGTGRRAGARRGRPGRRRHARPAGPARRPGPGQPTRCSSRCCGRPRHPPQGRPGPDRARLRRRRAAARRPEAQERRPVHHPPARGRHDPRRARHDRARRSAAALLHDTVEDTAVHARRSCAADFGDEVAHARRRRDQARQGQVRRRRAGRDRPQDGRRDGRDIRVLVIKLADRLHNMRTCATCRRRQQERKARETLEIYAPLAHRLGMNTIKWELEDLSFATLYPKVYDEIVRLVAERAPLARGLPRPGERAGRGRPARPPRSRRPVTGRPKHYYSIYQKMIVRGRDFADIYDLVGVRVLVETVRDCYAVLGVAARAVEPGARAGSRTTSRCPSSTCTSRCTRR